LKRILPVIFLLTFTLSEAAAQYTDTGKGISLGGSSSSRSGLMDMTDPVNSTKMDVLTIPPEYGTKYDKQMEEMGVDMEARKWSTEPEAWDRAQAINTKDSYQKYINLYPTGMHRGAADKKIIDFEIDDILNGDHDALPGMKCISEDNDSPTSTIKIENFTDYPLTVLYSGTESKSILISPRGKTSVTITNGFYRIAASVPDRNIRPFAGEEYVSGGRYETGYCIVYGR